MTQPQNGCRSHRLIQVCEPSTANEWKEAMLESSIVQPAAVGGSAHKSRVDTGIRRSKVAFQDMQRHPNIYNVVNQAILRANRELFGFVLDGHSSFQLTKYSAEDAGHYGWHVDYGEDSWSPSCRKVSAVLQLTCPACYEGGQLEIQTHLKPTPEDIKRQGMLTIFPSNVHHRVTPVTRGVRWSLVCWYTGPRWR